MTVEARSPKHAAAPPASAWASVRRSAGARILVLPISAILGIVNTRLIVEHFGSAAYAQYGLLVGIGSLIPFADLGMSAALMNAVSASDDPAHDPHVRRILTTAIRVLVSSAGVLLIVTGVITAVGWWPRLLGDGLLPDGGPAAAALCVAMIAISMPAGIGQRVWTGLGRNHVSIALLGLQTPVVLICLIGIVTFHTGGGSYLPVIPYVVTFAISVVSTFLAGRQIGPAFWGALRDAPRLSSVRGGKVFDVAWPVLIQMIALPIAMQTDRLILSHVSDLKNLAEYNLASQLYLPVWQVVSSAGLALWPVFARARASGGSRSDVSPLRMSVAFGGAAAAVCVVISLLAPWLAARASGGRIDLGIWLLIWFSIFMVFQATKYPLGMYLTDARGLRYQALMIVLLLPVNLGLSWYLAARIGAVGPVIGSTIGVFCCQVVANWVYVRRDLRAKAAA